MYLKTSLLGFALLVSNAIGYAQLTMPADGGSTKAIVAEKIGLTDVTINYGRPALRGREGHIWGELVHKGFEDDATFGKARKIPWRAGANESTTIEFSTDVTIEGKKLAAGKYGFFVVYDPTECTIIFNKNTGGWGSYFYDKEDDVLRVNVKPKAQNYLTERLTYTFSDQTDSSAVVSLVWEKLSIPFTVSTELQKLQLASIAKEMNSTKSFDPQSYVTAASYYLANDVNMDLALKYINAAARSNPSFYVLSTKSSILEKMGKTGAADSTMNEALAKANVSQVHAYGRQLLAAKQPQKALEVFKTNYKKNPDTYTTNMGMARGFSAVGDYKQALKYANKALPQAPDAMNKTSVEKIIVMLKEGKDING